MTAPSAFMLDKEFTDMLACPETGQPLAEAGPDVRLKLNALIEKGEISDSGGNPVTETADGFLVTEDRSRFYPVNKSIPVLLAGKSILAGKNPAL